MPLEYSTATPGAQESTAPVAALSTPELLGLLADEGDAFDAYFDAYVLDKPAAMAPIDEPKHEPADQPDQWTEAAVEALTHEERLALPEEVLDAYLAGELATGRPCKIGKSAPTRNTPQPQETQGFAPVAVEDCLVVGETLLPSTPSRVPSTPSPVPFHHSTATRNQRDRRLFIKSALDAMRDPFSLPWRKLWRHEINAVAYEAAGNRNGLFVTLHLSKKIAAALLASNDPADLLRRRVQYQLKRTFGRVLPFAFQFELANRLHVHGVMILDEDTPESREKLAMALRNAGGLIKGRFGSGQCVFREITDGLGLGAYLAKAFDETCSTLGTHKITFINRDLLDLARKDHANFCNKGEVLNASVSSRTAASPRLGGRGRCAAASGTQAAGRRAPPQPHRHHVQPTTHGRGKQGRRHRHRNSCPAGLLSQQRRLVVSLEEANAARSDVYGIGNVRVFDRQRSQRRRCSSENARGQIC
ncbi:MAG TPA: hypothetical protein VGN97_01045 [Mesorhizobium sp.]|jgi:hypothetical protein|nr:hypothetical protein [Mesorhizobium sp.]